MPSWFPGTTCRFSGRVAKKARLHNIGYSTRSSQGEIVEVMLWLMLGSINGPARLHDRILRRRLRSYDSSLVEAN